MVEEQPRLVMLLGAHGGDRGPVAPQDGAIDGVHPAAERRIEGEGGTGADAVLGVLGAAEYAAQRGGRRLRRRLEGVLHVDGGGQSPEELVDDRRGGRDRLPAEADGQQPGHGLHQVA